LAVAVFPDPSVTVQITVVFPKGYVVDEWSFVTVATEQLSPVVGVPKATPVAEHVAALTFTVTSAGAVMVGFTVSSTQGSIEKELNK